MDKLKKHSHKKSEIFEYEDFGEPTMYLWAILSVLLMAGFAVLFAMILAGSVVYVGGLIK